MISVIIPFKNTEKYIKECLESVLNQTYKNIEIILINDHSTDKTLSIVQKYHDKRIKILNLKEETGTANARNLGIKKANGMYISFIDSDDIWEKDKLEKQIKEIKHHAFLFGSYSFLKNKKTKKVNMPVKLSYKDYLKNTIILTSTVMINMNYYTKEEVYMPDIFMGEDAATWLKLLKKYDAYAINENLAYYRIRKGSLSSNKINALKRTWKVFKKENLPLYKRIYYYLNYIMHAIIKRI